MKERSQKTLMAAYSTWEALDNIARACGLEVENGSGAGKPAKGRLLDLLVKYPDMLVALARKAMAEDENAPEDSDSSE